MENIYRVFIILAVIHVLVIGILGSSTYTQNNLNDQINGYQEYGNTFFNEENYEDKADSDVTYVDNERMAGNQVQWDKGLGLLWNGIKFKPMSNGTSDAEKWTISVIAWLFVLIDVLVVIRSIMFFRNKK